MEVQTVRQPTHLHSLPCTLQNHGFAGFSSHSVFKRGHRKPGLGAAHREAQDRPVRCFFLILMIYSFLKSQRKRNKTEVREEREGQGRCLLVHPGPQTPWAARILAAPTGVGFPQANTEDWPPSTPGLLLTPGARRGS